MSNITMGTNNPTLTREEILRDEIEKRQVELDIILKEKNMNTVLKELLIRVDMVEKSESLTREIIAHNKKAVEIDNAVATIMENTKFGNMCDKCLTDITWKEVLKNHCPMAVICSVYERGLGMVDWSGESLNCLEKWRRK
ncbi:MAG: hypothetical protein ACRC45_00590 [Cetobacterium sp.]